MAAKVKLNSAGMRQLLNAPGVGADLMRRAQSVLRAAQASAPIATGAYRASLRAFPARTDRVVARVGSSVAHANVVEARTGNLSRAIDAGGGA